MFDLLTGQSVQVAQHSAPIKAVKWIDAPQGGILVTGSWDKTVKVCGEPLFNKTDQTYVPQYWDIRSSAPVATVQLPGRCYTLDVQYPLMVVGTSERHVQLFNLNNPGTALKV